MKRGQITIKANDVGNITVNLELIDGNVWMTKSEIAYLFDVFTSSVTSRLNAMFKDNEPFENEVTIHYKHVTYYNLDVIIALSFRLSGGYALHFRKWIREQIVKSLRITPKAPIIIQINENTFLA